MIDYVQPDDGTFLDIGKTEEEPLCVPLRVNITLHEEIVLTNIFASFSSSYRRRRRVLRGLLISEEKIAGLEATIKYHCVLSYLSTRINSLSSD